MSHTQDMVMITPAISLAIFEGDIQVFVKQNNFKVLNSTCVKVTAEVKNSLREGVRNIPKGPNGDFE